MNDANKTNVVPDFLCNDVVLGEGEKKTSCQSAWDHLLDTDSVLLWRETMGFFPAASHPVLKTCTRNAISELRKL